jgi:2,4-dienoyl-CoA reductase-like NADH-dependent reductase (Old Yellow Enzyme family)
MKMTMSELFSPFTLRSLTLENRVVVSPMCQYICNGDGQMHDWHLMHLGQLAMGGAGLVFTEASHVSEVGRIIPRCAGLWNDTQEAAMKRVVNFCKAHGVAKTAIQLAHAGRKASCTPNDGAWPSERPMGVRISAVDWVEGGTTIVYTAAHRVHRIVHTIPHLTSGLGYSLALAGVLFGAMTGFQLLG